MEAVLEKIRGRFAAVDPNGPRKVLGVFQLNVQTEDGIKNYVCDLKKLELTEGVADAPDVVIDTDEETMVQTSNKEVTFADAETSGKATVSGDRVLLETLTEVLKSCSSN